MEEQNVDVIEAIRRIFLSLPGVVEAESYGTPSYKLNKKLLARHHEDGVTLVVRMDFDSRDFLLEVNPLTYYITDHYKNYPYILARLSQVDVEELKGHIHAAWRSVATKKMTQESQRNEA